MIERIKYKKEEIAIIIRNSYNKNGCEFLHQIFILNN